MVNIQSCCETFFHLFVSFSQGMPGARGSTGSGGPRGPPGDAGRAGEPGSAGLRVSLLLNSLFGQRRGSPQRHLKGE